MTQGAYQRIQVEAFDWFIKVVNNKVERLDFIQKEELYGIEPLVQFFTNNCAFKAK